MVLCRFFSRTVGNCEESEITEGLDRRPREPDESVLSFVDSVELLADDECLLSVAEAGERFPVACSADGSQAGSCLKGWSMLYVYDYKFPTQNDIHNAAIIIAPKKRLRNARRCNVM